jgi:tetratricopeptide (TPR) repeat protein
MRLRTIILAALALTLAPCALGQQQPAAPPCPERDTFFELPIDEYIAQADKDRKRRNKNPLPENFCIGGWCAGSGEPRKPRSKEEKEAAEAATVAHETRSAPAGQSSSRDTRAGQSSSKETKTDTATPLERLIDPRPCDLEAVKRDIAQTVKDVEVGDFYFSDKKYRAALSRFQDADTRKPNDAAILLRLARTLEKLDQREEALARYRAVADSGWEGPGVDEAKAAVARLMPAN